MNERIREAVEQLKAVGLHDAAVFDEIKGALLATTMAVRAQCKHTYVHHYGVVHLCEECRLVEWVTAGDKMHELAKPRNRADRSRVFHHLESNTALNRRRIELMLEKNTLRNLIL